MELDPAALRATDPLVVNEHEAALVLEQLEGGADETGPGPAAQQSPEEVLQALVSAGVRSAVLTLGAEGSLVADAAGMQRIPAAPVRAVDTTGAGDAFIGALAVGLARGESLAQAAVLASRVGAFAATGHGAPPSYPSRSDDLPALATDPR